MTEEETETLDVDRAFSGLELPGDLETFEGRVKSERVDLAHSDLIDLRKGLGKPTPGVRYESRKFDLEGCGLLGREATYLVEEKLKMLYMYVLATESDTIETEKVVRMIGEFSRPLQEDGLIDAFRAMTRSIWDPGETARKQDAMIRETVKRMDLEDEKEEIRKIDESFLDVPLPDAAEIITGGAYLDGSLSARKNGEITTVGEEGFSRKLIDWVMDREGG